MEAEENRNTIIKHFKSLSDNPEKVNLQQVWKSLKKLWPKFGRILPTAKRNHKGKIVSGQSELKKLLAKEYKERLRPRPVRPDLSLLRDRRKVIFQMKMKLAENSRSSPWKMSDLELALNNLKRNK